MPDRLPITGERTVPGVPEENYWFRRHEVAYEYVRPLVAGRDVLEVGCGEGYGTDLLARAARRVVGLDYDAATVAHAGRTYPTPFVRGNLASLPVRTGALDALVTLQVIEHVWHHGEFLSECRRVLRPDGLLVVSTPNRLTFSPGASATDRPQNLFHTREFTAAELADLVGACGFTVDAVLGLRAGPRLAGLEERHGGFVAAQLAGPPAEWSRALWDDVRSVTTADFVIGADGADDSLDLLLLARPR